MKYFFIPKFIFFFTFKSNTGIPYPQRNNFIIICSFYERMTSENKYIDLVLAYITANMIRNHINSLEKILIITVQYFLINFIAAVADHLLYFLLTYRNFTYKMH